MRHGTPGRVARTTIHRGVWRGTTPNCSSSSTLNYLDQLWMLASDRRHAKDDTVLMIELKTDWCRVQKLLGRSRDKAGSLMLG